MRGSGPYSNGAAELMDMRCSWHEYGGCKPKGQPGECPEGHFGDIPYRPKSWSCVLNFFSVETIYNNFGVVSTNLAVGYPPLEGPNPPTVNLSSSKFMISSVSTLFLHNGTLTLTCPKPLAQALPFTLKNQKKDTKGCRVAIENPFTADKLEGTCDGVYEVPHVLTTKAPTTF